MLTCMPLLSSFYHLSKVTSTEYLFKTAPVQISCGFHRPSPPQFPLLIHCCIPASNSYRHTLPNHRPCLPESKVCCPQTFSSLSYPRLNPQVAFLALQENQSSSLSSPLFTSQVDPTDLLLLTSLDPLLLYPRLQL